MLSSRQRLWNFFECLFRNELGATSEMAEQPEWIRTPLLPHQRTSVHAALQLERAKMGLAVTALPGEEQGGTLYSNYGIIGDRVGAGKSLIALSLVKYPPPPIESVEYIWRSYSHADSNVGLLRQRAVADLTPISTALFVMPHAIIGQWEDYVKQDTTMRCFFVKKRKDVDEALFTRLTEYDALFVSATMWREFDGMAAAHNLLWSRVFLDEADTLMFAASSIFLRARFTWLISASWMNLVFAGGAYFNMEQSLKPLESTEPYTAKRMGRYISNNCLNIGGVRSPVIRAICGNVNANAYNVAGLNAVIHQSTRLLIHNSEEFIQRSFEVPDIQHDYYLCLAPPNIQILRAMVSDELMERLHAGDTTGALDVLGMQTRTADEIVSAVTDTVEKELNMVRRTYEFRKTMEYSSETAKAKSLQAYEERIARLSSRVDAIRERLMNTGDQTCPICYDEVSTPALTPCCRNLFCFACICEVLRRTPVCPMCREMIPNVQAVQVLGKGTDATVDTERPQLLSKQEQLRTFLRANPTARVLLFSAYDATFEGLESMLETEGVSRAVVAGSQARIAKLLKQFGEGKYRVLFLNAKNMGAGLNIAAASHVVLYHRMPVEMKNQIIGRAVRMGRTEPLTVLHFLHGNEMLVRNEEGLTTGSSSSRIEHVL